MRAQGVAARRWVVSVLALPALVAACGWPGSDQVAEVVRCARQPQAAPPAATSPLPAVWRTHSMPVAGYSIALPDNWDGLALGTATQQAGLAAAARRSPALGEDLRKFAGEGSLLTRGTPAYLAIGTRGERLDVGVAFGARLPISCAGAPFVDALSSADNPGQIRQTRFPAGDATVLTDHTLDYAGGQQEPFTNWLFVLGAPGGQDLVLLFSVYRPDADAEWPVVWAAMGSLRRAPDATADGADPQPACLFPDLAERELTARHPAPCAVALGRRLGAASCGRLPADPDHVMAAVVVPRGGGDSTPAGGQSMDDNCLFAVPENSAVWLSAGPVGADLVAYVDLEFPVGGKPIASIDMRQQGDQALSATAAPGGGLFLTEYGVGGAAATSLSATTLATSARVHRLVLSAVGSTLHAWLDGVETTTVRTRVTHAGTAGIYLTTEDGTSTVLTVLGGAVYTAG